MKRKEDIPVGTPANDNASARGGKPGAKSKAAKPSANDLSADAHEKNRSLDREFASFIRTLHLPRYNEIPAIELYMDQVLTYVDHQLRPLLPEGEKILTSSMVNNYVKQKLIPTPSHKRYTREHVALLIFICLMKRTVSIADIKRLFAVQEATHSTERAYDFFCTAAEESLRALFCGTIESRSLGDWTIDEPDGFAFSLRIDKAGMLSPERRLVISAATATANKIYIEKCLELESTNDA